MAKFKIGDVVHGKKDEGFYRKDRHFKLTGVNGLASDGETAYYYEPVNFENSNTDWIYEYQIGGLVEDTKFKPGDKVRMHGSDNVYTLKKRDPERDGYYGTAWKLEKGTWLGEEQFELAFKNGDKAVLISDDDAATSGFEIGDTVTVVDDNWNTRHDYAIKNDRNGTTGYCYAYQLGRIERTERRPTVGGTVKVVGKSMWHSLDIGDIVVIIEDERDEQPYHCRRDDGRTQWLTEKDVELVAQSTKFKPGDKVRGKSTGNVYTLTHRAPEYDGRSGLAWRHEETPSHWVGEDQIELVEEQPVGKSDVVEYLARISDGEMLDLIEEARTTRGGQA